MAVRGYALRAAELVGAAAGPVTSVALITGCALLGVAAAGAGGAVVAIVLAAMLVAAVIACWTRMALSAMLARPVSEVEHPELYRLVRELSKDGRLPVPRLYLSPAEQPNSFAVGRGPRSPRSAAPRACSACWTRPSCTGGGRDRARVRPRPPGSTMSPAWPPSSRYRPACAGWPGFGALEQALMLLFGRPLPSSSGWRSTRSASTGRMRPGRCCPATRWPWPPPCARSTPGTEELALAPDGRRISVGHLMIAKPFRPEGLARLFRTHPPGERVRRLEALAGYRR